MTTHFFFAHSGETIIWDFGEVGGGNESGQVGKKPGEVI